jgi:hypothetical protein
MAEHRAADYQRAIAERNVGAILDAAEELLEERAAASISAVDHEGGHDQEAGQPDGHPMTAAERHAAPALGGRICNASVAPPA